MSASPIITFKAGMCELDQESSTPRKVVAKPTPGYIYLYKEDDLPHFCWRPRSAPPSNAPLDLIMFPGDGTFKPYQPKGSGSQVRSPTNGRIYVLKFSSSSSRYPFWLQSKSQHASGDAGWFSPRDLKLGEIVNQLLQGEEVNVEQEIANLSDSSGGDGDTAMEDAGADILDGVASGGAGADATGGDIREEGEESREGGADGGRAAAPLQSQTQAAVTDFLRSLQGNRALTEQAHAPREKAFTTLPDLLQPSTTLPLIETAEESYLDELLSHLPPVLLLLAQEVDDVGSVDPNSETAQAAMQALSMEQKRAILTKVLRSPQFSQSLGSLTMALRDGGLPTISDALKIQTVNGGYIRRGGVPLGGGEAVKAFLEGIKTSVEEEQGMDVGQ